MKTDPHYFKKRKAGFAYAFAGIARFMKQEPHAKLHAVATILLLIVSLALKVSQMEAIALVGMVGLVWITELLNTCVEKAMDFISTERDPKIMAIKDMAAGAVLIAAITALITALFIFIPKIL